MVEGLCKKARNINPSCRFAITWPVFVDDRRYEDRLADPCRPERVTYMNAGQTATESFWTSVGFRRIGSSPFFAFAMFGDHPSLALDKSEDYVRPLALRWPANNPESTFPIDRTFMEADDDQTLAILKQRAQSLPPDDSSWLATDFHGRNVMHILGLLGKPRALAFLETLPCATQLSSTRDLEGNTPLEWLQTTLNDMRSSQSLGAMTLSTSDDFKGHDANHVACLTHLNNTPEPNPAQMDRWRFGCTCGECIAGFISPRLAHALIYQGDVQGDQLGDDIGSGVNGFEWCEVHETLLQHLRPPVRQNLETNKSMREGFALLCSHVASTLRSHCCPTTANVLARAEAEWPPHTKSYIRRGGTVTAVVSACFDCAMEQDLYLGDGTYEEDFGEQSAQLKECGNDREFVFARRQLLRMEGLPANYPDNFRGSF